jgi:hypothetical protein
MKPDILNLSVNELKTQFLTSAGISEQNEILRPNLIAINIYFLRSLQSTKYQKAWTFCY